MYKKEKYQCNPSTLTQRKNGGNSMKKKIRNSVMVTVMALTLIFSGTTTAFAVEKEKTDLTPENIDVRINYKKGENILGGDDTKDDIYNILIAYDNLDYSYEAAAITWDTTNLEYNITTTSKDGTTRNIEVTNRSNTAVKMTPTLVDPNSKPDGVEYNVSLNREDATLWTSSNSSTATQVADGSKKLEWGKDSDNVDNLTVSVPAIGISSDAIDKTLSNVVVATVSLSFENAGKEK